MQPEFCGKLIPHRGQAAALSKALRLRHSFQMRAQLLGRNVRPIKINLHMRSVLLVDLINDLLVLRAAAAAAWEQQAARTHERQTCE